MKPALRQQLKAGLAGLDAGQVRAHSAAVWERLATLPEFTRAKSVCAYVSFGKEIETHGLIRQLLALGRQVCVPAFRGHYVPGLIEDFDRDLGHGHSGILEPHGHRLHTIPAAQIEAWLVPGLGFDAHGNRLGRGKGYFDALLKNAPGTKIALAHDLQVCPAIPAESHDVRMDFVVTEKRVLRAPAVV